MPLSLEEVQTRARLVRLVLLDVDGVLTDGTVAVHSGGGESKSFHIRDGAAMIWAARQGLEVGLLSGRPSEATSRRAAELGLKIVSQGGANKQRGYDDLVAQHGFRDAEIAYMADDLLDLPVIQRVGLSAAPQDATREVRERVHWVSGHRGGHGAAREFLELVLKAQGRWDAVVQGFLG